MSTAWRIQEWSAKELDQSDRDLCRKGKGDPRVRALGRLVAIGSPGRISVDFDHATIHARKPLFADSYQCIEPEFFTAVVCDRAVGYFDDQQDVRLGRIIARAVKS